MQEQITATWQWLKNEKRVVWFEYSALALAVMLPLLLPGFILTLDMVFTPNIAFPSEITNTYPLQILLWLLHFVLPADVIQKIVLFAILLLSGVGMHSLLRSLNMKDKVAPELWRIALYFGGLFYMINPFTYSRFMAGQWLFLLGYALLPFFVRALLRFFAAPSLGTSWKLAAWAFAIVTASIHHVAMLLILALLVPLLATIFSYWRKGQVKQYFIWSGASLGLLAVVFSYWLVPAALGHGDIGSAVASRSQADFAAFATNGNGALGAIGEVVRLQGFWADARQLYTLPQNMVPAWGVLFLLVWILVALGASKAWKASRMFVALSMTCVALGILLAASPLISWLSQYLPFAAGYREPHKFVNLIVLGYALLGTLGVAFTIQWATDRFRELGGQVAIIVCLLLPLAITPAMLWGFGGQLSPRHYPSEWYAVDQTLSEVQGPKRTLFLPWHQYMAFKFSGRIIANPAEKFFTTPVIASDDPEYGSITPTIPNKEKSDIKAALDQPDALVDILKHYRINYILLAKDDDASSYDFLDKQPALTVITDNHSLKLYRVGE